MSDTPSEHDRNRGAGLSTGTWIMLSVTLLISLAIHHAIYEAVLEPGFKQAPQTAPVPPASQTKTPSPVTPRDSNRIDTSLDSILEFDAPPMFSEPHTETENELQKTLSKREDDRVSVGGKVLLDEESTMQNPVLDGGIVELEITTE